MAKRKRYYFKAKPIVVQARQLTKENRAEVQEWCYGFDDLDTLGVEEGEWIVLDNGDYQVMSDEFFRSRYEELS